MRKLYSSFILFSFSVAMFGQCPMVVNSSKLSDANCYGQCTGSAYAVASNGTPPYHYLWMPGSQTTQTATGLCPGTYTISVTDATPCPAVTATVAIGQNPPLTVSTWSWSPICIGDCSSITANASGGDGGPYTYSWTPAITQPPVATCPTVTTTYTVLAADGLGCTATGTTAIIVNPKPVCTICPSVDTICVGQSVVLIANGGVCYSWYPGGQTTAAIQVSPTITTTYSVSVIDANGCSYIYQGCFTTYPMTVYVSPCTGVNDIFSLEDFQAYPNPTSNGLFEILFTSGKEDNLDIEIRDELGQIVYSETLNKFSGRYKQTLNLSQFGRGVYFIAVTNKEKTFLRRKIIY
ncbi:MAG: T9SS type A sorting domain-containing protein [Bacteroidetes bacterium]|nr:T9SS type A sorting domain-containing protein [Bacteroidota bacterium]